MIRPPRDIFRPSFVSTSSFGVAVSDPVTSTVTAALDFTTAVIESVTGSKSARSSAIASATAQNPCAQRVQAQIASLGPKPVFVLTQRQKDERDKRKRLEDQLRRLLANPQLCPEVKAMQNPPPPVEVPLGASPLTYVIGAVILTSAVGGTVYLLRRKKK